MITHKRKLLVISQYYHPDGSAVAQIYRELCGGLADDFDITVIASFPCYNGQVSSEYLGKKRFTERVDGIPVIRVPVKPYRKTHKLDRVRNILGYYFGARKAIRRSGRFDAVLAMSQPPILAGLLGVYAKRKKKCGLIYNIQDFNPEQIVAVDYSGNGLVIGLLARLDKRTCRKADLVITVGADMRETLEKRFYPQPPPKNAVITNWVNERDIFPLPADDPGVLRFREDYRLGDRFVVMYSGNLGLYYDLDLLLRIMGRFREREDVVFALVGEGAMKEKLEAYANGEGLRNVVFIPYQGKDRLIYSLNAADVHIVNSGKGMKGVSVPSKVYGAMAVNKPVFAVLESGSEAYETIREAKCGLCCEPGDEEAIYRNLALLLDGKQEVCRAMRTGREALTARHAMERSIRAYADCIRGLVDGR